MRVGLGDCFCMQQLGCCLGGIIVDDGVCLVAENICRITNATSGI